MKSFHKLSGIERRWILNSVSLMIALVLAFVVVFSVSFSAYCFMY